MRRLATCLTVIALGACETPATPPDEPTPSGPAPSGASGPAAPTAAAPDASAQIPPEVGHIENPAFKDIPTPMDMPPLDTAAAEAKIAQVAKDYDAAFKAACKAGGTILRLVTDPSRVGYQSYKNKNLPVAGLFERASGFAVLGPKAQSGRGWIDPLSLNSGDPVRDRKLKKLFFELEQAGNAEMVFTVSRIDGALPTAEGAVAPMLVVGELTLHQKKKALELPLSVTKKGATYTATLQNPVQLLELADFDYLKAAAALIASCNHHALGDAVNLQLELVFAEGCDV